MKLRPCTIVAGIYVTLCVMSLALVPLSAAGGLGVVRDPLAAVFAVLVGLPWSLLALKLSDGTSLAVSLALIAIGMAINTALLLTLCRLVGRLFRRA